MGGGGRSGHARHRAADGGGGGTPAQSQGSKQALPFPQLLGVHESTQNTVVFFSQFPSNFENRRRKYRGSKPNRADEKWGKKIAARFALGSGGNASRQAPIFLRF